MTYPLSSGEWMPKWHWTRIPTAPRYIEALLLHWVRYKDTQKEMFWYFKLYDICQRFDGFHGTHILRRMEPHCRDLIMLCLNELNDTAWEDTSGVLRREVLLEAEQILQKRAGPR